MTRKSMEPEVLAYIESNPYCTTRDIYTALNKDKRSIERALNRMLRDGQIHIADFERVVPGSGRIARQFLAGPGKNVTPPKPTKARRRTYKTEWQRRKRASESVIKRASRNAGPFGMIVAQLTR